MIETLLEELELIAIFFGLSHVVSSLKMMNKKAVLKKTAFSVAHKERKIKSEVDGIYSKMLIEKLT